MDLAIRQILAPVDLGDSSRPALRVARLLAERFGAGITALYVDESLTLQTYDSMFSGRTAQVRSDETSTRPVRQYAAPALAPVDPQIEVVADDPARAIIRAAHRCRADLIVMGTHSRRGLRRLLDRSVAETVLRTSACPVLVVPEISAQMVLGRIVCAVDGSEPSRAAARFAIHMAGQFGSDLVFARVAGAPVPWTASSAPKPDWREVVIDRGTQRIFRCAREAGADLLIVGSQQLPSSRSQIAAGLCAEDLIRSAPCAVLEVVSECHQAALPEQKRVLATA